MYTKLLNKFYILLILFSCFSCQEKQLNYFETFVRKDASNKDFGRYHLNMTTKDWSLIHSDSLIQKNKAELVFQKDSSMIIQNFNFDEKGLFKYQLSAEKLPHQEQFELQCIAYFNRELNKGKTISPHHWIWKQIKADNYVVVETIKVNNTFFIKWQVY